MVFITFEDFNWRLVMVFITFKDFNWRVWLGTGELVSLTAAHVTTVEEHFW